MKRKRRPQTPQERCAVNAAARQKAANAVTLFVNGLTREEVDTLRARFLYSGASDDYIATYASQLAVATLELLTLRGRKKARLRLTPSGLVLTCKKAVRRFAACAPNLQEKPL